MDLTPELLLEAKFGPARRGYNMDEVDDFLERCAEGLDELIGRCRADFDRAQRAEAEVARLQQAVADLTAAAEAAAPTGAVTPVASDDRADDVGAAAPAAEAPAVGSDERAADGSELSRPMRILIHAERTANEAIAAARADADRIVSLAQRDVDAAREQAESIIESAQRNAELEARRAGDAARRTLEAELDQLNGDRDALARDVRVLQRWMEEQRARLRSTAVELQRVVDDPKALREVALPDLGAPAPDDDTGRRTSLESASGHDGADADPGMSDGEATTTDVGAHTADAEPAGGSEEDED